MKHPFLSWMTLLFSGALGLLLVLNFLWLRRLARKLLHAQILFYKAAALLQKAQKERASSVPVGTATGAKRTPMSVEGHLIEIVQVDGKEIVCFEEDASEAERARILAYLKTEGFLP